MINKKYFIFVLLFLSTFSNVIIAKAPTSVKTKIERIENEESKESLILPYAFSTDDLGLLYGLGFMSSGGYQEQMSIGATIFGGDESKGWGFGVFDYRLRFSERLFISTIGMQGDYPLMRAYAPTDRGFFDTTQPRPGSHNSNFEDFIESSGSSNWWDLHLEYVFPLGDAKDSPVAHYQLEGGLLSNKNNNKKAWNPLKNGTTILSLRQFNRYQFYERGDESLEGTIHAVELGLFHDNTDLPVNPSTGNSQYIAVTHDAAWLDSRHQWTFAEIELSQYFSLGSSNHAHQRIVALNFWTGYSSSWNINTNELNQQQVTNNPPFLEGATLGGFYRMRGYRQNRFHDKAAIYGSAEYRYTLKYNPTQNVEWLQFLKLDWIQAVIFAEAGRVSPTYNRDTLFDDWKTDYGVSLRALTAGIVIRLDVAHSEEGTHMWAMISHPF